MNLFGTILVLFLSPQGIFPGKTFLVETKEKEAARWWSFFSYPGSRSIPANDLPFSTVTEDEDEDEQDDSSREEEEEQEKGEKPKGKEQESDSYEEQEVIVWGKF